MTWIACDPRSQLIDLRTPDKDVVAVEISAYEASKLVDEIILSLKTASPRSHVDASPSDGRAYGTLSANW